MKSLVMALVLSAAPVAVLAYNNMSPADMDIDYISWCDNNNVVNQDQNGTLVIVANCSTTGKVCKEKQMIRANRMVMAATCR